MNTLIYHILPIVALLVIGTKSAPWGEYTWETSSRRSWWEYETTGTSSPWASSRARTNTTWWQRRTTPSSSWPPSATTEEPWWQSRTKPFSPWSSSTTTEEPWWQRPKPSSTNTPWWQNPYYSSTFSKSPRPSAGTTTKPWWQYPKSTSTGSTPWWQNPQYSSTFSTIASSTASAGTTTKPWWQYPTTTSSTPWWQNPDYVSTLKPSTASQSSSTSTTTAWRWTTASKRTAISVPVSTSKPPYTRYNERQCACNPANLYLDLVVVVDSSLSMTKDGLMEIAADLATIFQQVNIDETPTGHYVRVGLITFSGNVSVVGSLNSFTNYDQLIEELFSMPYHGDDQLNIEMALQEASRMLEQSRNYVKTAILLYTSAYSATGYTDPKAIANQISESGTAIITVAFRQQPEGSLVRKLSQLASSESFSFASMEQNIVNKTLYAFCQVNCYCKNNWMQYKDSRTSYGECVRLMDIDASWVTASFACKAMASGAHLVNLFTHPKQDFVGDYVAHVLRWGTTYSVGLRFDPSTWNYAWQGENNTKIPVTQPLSWDAGYPDRSKGDCVAFNNGPDRYKNVNCLRSAMRYVCQMPACDTENFCSSFDD